MEKIKKIVAVTFTCMLLTTTAQSIISQASGNTKLNNENEMVMNRTAVGTLEYINFHSSTDTDESEQSSSDDDNIKEPIVESTVSTNDTVSTHSAPSNKEDNSEVVYSKNELYELAKIIMCEAEGESQKCKEYIAQVIFNRIESSKFPDTIHNVIWQRNQFTPTFDGRWEKVEPNQDCYDAIYTVLNAKEPLTEALYFEACNGSSWHDRNLTKIAEIDNTRFYVE